MIVDENKTFLTVANIGLACTFKHSDTYFMRIEDIEPHENDGYTMCVDIESGYVCYLKNNTPVETINCRCVVERGKI